MALRVHVLALLLAASSVVGIAETGGGELRLRSAVDVDAGARLVAADLVASPDGRGAACLREVLLGRAPGPTRARVLSRRRVEDAIVKAGCFARDQELRGAPSVQVRARGLSLTEDDVRAALEPLRSRLEERGLEMALDIPRLPAPLALAPGPHDIEALIDAGKLASGRHQVPLVVSARGVERRTHVVVEVRLTASVFVASRVLRRGRILAETDLRRARAELPRRCEPVAELAELVGSETKRSLDSGEVVCRRYLRRPYAVSAGEPVTVILENGAISLSFDTLARANGFVGEKVRIIGLDGHTTLDAVVVGPGRANVFHPSHAGSPQ